MENRWAGWIADDEVMMGVMVDAVVTGYICEDWTAGVIIIIIVFISITSI